MMMPSIFRENLFDDFMKDFAFPSFPDLEKTLYGKHGQNLMKTDVRETENAYEMDIELPGFSKDEVKVSLENGYMTIHAEKGLEKDEKDSESGKYIRRERFAGSCERTFYVGENLTENDIRGEFKQGILKLTVPKQETRPAVETKKYIAIEG